MESLPLYLLLGKWKYLYIYLYKNIYIYIGLILGEKENVQEPPGFLYGCILYLTALC